MSIPRPEYPRPQFTRPEWLNLNGEWQFEMDHGDSGFERGLVKNELKGLINVPFCPESALSGIGNVDFMQAVWYRRGVEIPKAWKGRHVLLNFQAVDYETTVWVNEKEVIRHRGGFSPFTCDLGGIAEPGTKATIVVRARDYKGEAKPFGKQCDQYHNCGCSYTRTTGIWQTVWMEPVPETYLKRPRLTPDVASGTIRIDQPIAGAGDGLKLRAKLKDAKGEICVAETSVVDFSPTLTLRIPADRRRVWSIEDPHLYDIEIELQDKKGLIVDRASSYAGLRSITIRGKAVQINGKSVFQRLVLDQGFYPDGILTASSDEALKRDIELSMQAGFNGARLHQKVFEERFLYHCDKLGYIVWGEFPDWGIDRDRPSASYVAQWLEVIERDYSHPSIVGWCPLNETAQPIPDRIPGLNDITRALFMATKVMDMTRPVLDTSGYSHREWEANIYDCHDYDQDPKTFKERHKGLAENKPFINGSEHNKTWSIPYRGQPYFVSEFGGIWWNPNVKPGEPSWGYGQKPKDIEEFYTRFEGLCAVLLDDPNMFGYCYTQLTDVYQEQNGIYLFGREKKFDMARIRKAQQKKAAIEK
jgi:beta-galactosidase/beta-glucuronidase